MSVQEALDALQAKFQETDVNVPIPFDAFISYLSHNPQNVFRNIFQLFSDMINYYVGEGVDEYPGDPDSINFINYDCRHLFVEGTDSPFFADRPFANRLVNLAKSFRSGAQCNKIYIFEGPTGSGKSTFLNNIFLKLEEFTKTGQGTSYEIVWKLDKFKITGFSTQAGLVDRYQNVHRATENVAKLEESDETQQLLSSVDTIEVPCPSHDNPILIIPKNYREEFFHKVIDDQDFKKRLFNAKEFEWVFKDELCTICSSLYQTLLEKLKSPSELFSMVFARKYQFNRRLGEGISIYSPGDNVRKKPLTNDMQQNILNLLLRDSNAVRYVFSEFARTNNGIYAIMDVKSNNKDRLMNLHGIISDGIHRVEHYEEGVNSLFIALLNPEDKDVIDSVKSLGDRISTIPVPYVLDHRTEVEIYYNKFGKEIDDKFLPRVLENFAQVVISSRLNKKSANLSEWIPDPAKYAKYCDEDLLLLKMSLYTGIIPDWISEEDRKRFNAKRRRRIIGESEGEGRDENSISGRESIEIFSKFYSKFAKEGALIDMAMVYHFFSEKQKDCKRIHPGFLDSLVRLYDYHILQEIKESLYSYNKKEIANDIMNYLFAINFDLGSKATCIYTGSEIEISESFFARIEDKLLGKSSDGDRKKFRAYTQKEYTSKTLSYEIGVEGKTIQQTSLYGLLLGKYQHHLKEDVLNPFLENDNFRNAVKDFDTPAFKSYDKKIMKDVRFLIRNLTRKYRYSEEGAKQICIYVIDNKIPAKFSKV